MIELSGEEKIYSRYKEVYQHARTFWNKWDVVFKTAQDCIVAPKRVREVLENQDKRWDAFLSKINPNISNLLKKEEKYFASYHNRDCFIEEYNKMMLEIDILTAEEKIIFMNYLTTATNWHNVFEELKKAIKDFNEFKKLGVNCQKIINGENLSDLIMTLYKERESIKFINYYLNLLKNGCIDDGIGTSTLTNQEEFNYDDILKDIKQKKEEGLLPSEIFELVIVPLKKKMKINSKKNNTDIF